MGGIINSMNIIKLDEFGELWELVINREAWRAIVHGVIKGVEH